VVQGYKNEMPNPLRPPISLKPEEVKAVIAYLQSLGGTADVAAIRLPPGVEAAAKAVAGMEEWRPYLAGDPKKGEELFFNPDSNAACAKCHAVSGKGGAVGPELTEVAGTRDARFIIESILEPSKEIASGYEPILVVTKEGRYLTGIIKREDANAIEIVDNQGQAHKVPKGQIQQRAPQKTSLMPENFREILTVEEFHDLLAFLLTLK
jgi:putative heme-binding domain-containing protein